MEKQNEKNNTIDMENMKISKLAWKISLPMIISMISIALYGIVFATLKLYEKNYASKEETIKALKTYKLINQISFHTEKALSCIKYLGTEEVI